MKILMLSDFYPPIIGGMERYVQLLSRELYKRGHEITVCTTGYKESLKEDGGVEIYESKGFFQYLPFLFVDPEKRYHPPVQDGLITKRLEGIIRRKQPDIIHSHGWITYSVLPLKRKFDVPLVVTLHDYGFICPTRLPKTLTSHKRICNHEPFKHSCIGCGKEQYGLIKSFFAYYGLRINRKKLKFVDRFIAVSSFVREVYSRYLGLSDEKIVTIPCFLIIEKLIKLKEHRLSPQDFILFVGHLSPEKGVDVLMKAYNMLNTKTKLVLIGVEEPDYFYKSAENVIVIKNAPHEIVMDALLKCEFTVMPSIVPETFGLVALEAMRCKKAVIASAVGGLKDIIQDHNTGLLIPPNDSNELAKAMKYLLGKPIIRKEMGEKGYRRLIQYFSADKVIPQIESIYKDAIIR